MTTKKTTKKPKPEPKSAEQVGITPEKAVEMGLDPFPYGGGK